ncbi:MAG: flagellar export protein FliJ [Spirochaetae bacterium HGW-Spirochaetae-6]|nr:MAG: flagellar export protein FliJ [Spirochaetae bacterium HGW-Spirochaetae-6]
MKKFIFKLQKVLEYKQSIEDQKKAILGQHISRYNKIKQRMSDAGAQKDQILGKMGKETMGDLNYMNLVKNTLQGVSQTFINGKKELERIQLDINKAREAYVNAKQEREVFTKLKEKRYRLWQYSLKKDGQKSTSETAMQMWENGQIKEYEWT